jgi:hypothetical protein
MNSPSSCVVLRVSSIDYISLPFYLFSSLARAWSYDNVLTYPCMVLPVRTEKCLEKRIVDGVEREVEVKVELPLKRLFLFPAKKFIGTFPLTACSFSPTPCIVSNHHLHCIALSRTLYPHPHPPPTFSPPVLLPTLPTIPDLTSCRQHHHNLIYPLYYPLLVHASLPQLSFIIAHIRYHPCLTSAALSPCHLTVRKHHGPFSLLAFSKPQALSTKNMTEVVLCGDMSSLLMSQTCSSTKLMCVE